MTTMLTREEWDAKYMDIWGEARAKQNAIVRKASDACRSKKERAKRDAVWEKTKAKLEPIHNEEKAALAALGPRPPV